MQSVEDGALVEELALGRVDVLASQRVVLAQLARLEPDDAAARVGEREHQALRKVVVAARVDEPGRLQLVGREAALAGLLRKPSSGREPEPELPRRLVGDAAAREIVAHRLAGRGVPEVPLEEARRLVEHGEEPFATLARLLGAR